MFGPRRGIFHWMLPRVAFGVVMTCAVIGCAKFAEDADAGVSDPSDAGASDASEAATPSKLVVLTTGGEPTAVACDEQEIFFTDPTMGEVRAVSKSSGRARVVAGALAQPTHVFIEDATRVAFVVNGDNSCSDTLSRVAKVGGKPTSVFSACGGPGLAGVGQTTTSFYATTWWSSGGSLIELGKSSSGATTLFTVTNASPALGVVAAFGKWVFYALANGVLQQFERGVGTTTMIAKEQGRIQDIVADADAVYWTSDLGDVMTRPLDGVSPSRRIATGQASPSRLAIHGEEIYWTNAGTNTGGSVMVAKKREPSGEPTFIARDQKSPFGICADASGVYWANRGDGTLMRSPR